VKQTNPKMFNDSNRLKHDASLVLGTSKIQNELSLKAHTNNACYSGGGDRRITIRGQLPEKVQDLT
jgi:hypothetical protein